MTNTISPEEKVLQKIVNIMTSNAVINGFVKGRVYASHISSIKEPMYPAGSLFLLSSRSVFELVEMVQIEIQIDWWFLEAKNTMSDVMAVHRKARELLHRQSLTDTEIDLIVASCVEVSSGQLLYEEDTGLYHYPSRYQVVAA